MVVGWRLQTDALFLLFRTGVHGTCFWYSKDGLRQGLDDLIIALSGFTFVTMILLDVK